jgi:hypothetical protein
MQIHADLRASPRVPAKIPIHVQGRDVRHQPVDEDCETLLINAGGALIALGSEFQLHDRIRVTNLLRKVAADARVAWRSSTQINGRWSYGVALIDPPEGFWGEPPA